MTHRCDPKVFEKDLTDQIIIVTGANSGIGLATAHQLAYQKATVILACRNEAKAKVAIDEIDDPEHTVFMPLDLSDLSSVRKFVQTFTSKYDRLDALVNNAGVMACPFGRTKDGFETHIGCNHLGHFLLFKLLTPVLLRTAEDTCKPSRFIALSSCYSSAANSPGAKSYPKIDFDDFNWESKPYHKIHAYQQSKFANYLTAWEASKKYDSSKLICASLHPGWVRSNLDQHFMSNGYFATFTRYLIEKTGYMINVLDGSETTLHCILSDACDMVNGGFYSQHGIYYDKYARPGGWPLKLPNPNATSEVASKLWAMSEKLVGADLVTGFHGTSDIECNQFVDEIKFDN